MVKSIKLEDLVKEINSSFNEYSEEVIEAVDAATWETANKAKNQVIKNIDSAGINSRKYKKAISARTFKEGRIGTQTGLVFVKAPHYRLTHLLENGHVIKNANGSYGRTKARPHWEPAQKKLETDYPNAVRDKIEKIR